MPRLKQRSRTGHPASRAIAAVASVEPVDDDDVEARCAVAELEKDAAATPPR
jgi:hypothetical protein